MSFKSRRLRVQLPCGDRTLFDVEEARAAGDAVSEAPCDWIHHSAPPCAHLTCLDLPCQTPFGSPCGASGGPPECPGGFITPDVHCPAGHATCHGTISLPDCPNSAPHRCFFHSHDPCVAWETKPCAAESCQWDTGCHDTIPIMLPTKVEGTVLADPRALPLLRSRLEQELRRIEAAEQSKEALRERLDEIDRAERQLRDLDDDGGGER